MSGLEALTAGERTEGKRSRAKVLAWGTAGVATLGAATVTYFWVMIKLIVDNEERGR